MGIPESVIAALTGSGVAGVFCVLFIIGWIVPKSVVDDLRAERDALKAAVESERDRAEAAVAAAQATRDVFQALQEGVRIGQEKRPPGRDVQGRARGRPP